MCGTHTHHLEEYKQGHFCMLQQARLIKKKQGCLSASKLCTLHMSKKYHEQATLCVCVCVCVISCLWWKLRLFEKGRWVLLPYDNDNNNNNNDNNSNDGTMTQISCFASCQRHGLTASKPHMWARSHSSNICHKVEHWAQWGCHIGFWLPEEQKKVKLLWCNLLNSAVLSWPEGGSQFKHGLKITSRKTWLPKKEKKIFGGRKFFGWGA